MRRSSATDVPGIERDLQRPGVGVADVLGGHAHHPARDIERVAAAIEHPRQPIERRIGGRTAHRLVQRRDLVVEEFAALVEAAHLAAAHLHHHLVGDAPLLGQAGGILQQVEGAAGIAIGGLRHEREVLFVDLQPLAAQAPLAVFQRTAQHRQQLFPGEGFEHVDPGPREQRVVQLEGGILGSGAHEEKGAVLHVGQESFLLALVETVHLVNEKQRAPPLGPVLARKIHRGTDLLHARKNGRKGMEGETGVVGQHPGQRGLAGSRGAPEDHGVELSLFDGAAQGPALAQDVGLSLVLAQGAGPHAVGQGPAGQRLGSEEVTGRGCHNPAAGRT